MNLNFESCDVNISLMGKEVIWTDMGLDGACSYSIFNWIKKTSIDAKSCFSKNFRTSFESWIASDEASSYDKIYILDLDVSKHLDLVDRPNVTIIDHHKVHVDFVKKYQHAKVVIEDVSSTSKLLLKLFSKSIQFTKQQLALIALVDDFESGSDKSPLSKHLNWVYWGLSGKQPQKFASEFSNGFSSFTLSQQNIIEIHRKRLNETLETMDVYVGTLKLSADKQYKIASTFANNSHTDICDHLISTHGVDIAIIVNTDTQNVFFKKSKTCSLPVYKLAQSLCEGGGTDLVAGGSITEKFMDFTKILNKL